MTHVNAAAQAVRQPSHALRLTFAYDGNRIRLIRSQRVAMMAPPSVTAPPQEGHCGYWFEVRDRNGALLYHRVVHDPIRTDHEIFSDDPKQSITRVPKMKPEGQFTLLVPEMTDAHSFHLFGSPPDGETRARSAPSRELVVHTFDELRPANGSDSAAPAAGEEGHP
jgi:hypothetical protein